jgi:hypothetical protein
VPLGTVVVTAMGRYEVWTLPDDVAIPQNGGPVAGVPSRRTLYEFSVCRNTREDLLVAHTATVQGGEVRCQTFS